MFGDVVIFRSVPTALSVIYTARKYMVRGIDKLALIYISKNITTDNVLLVLQTLLVLYDSEQSVEDSTSNEVKTEPDDVHKIIDLDAKRIQRYCFNIIDKNAKKVLEGDEVEDISLYLLKAIICRDSLRVPSELLVWQALHRWSHRQCRRKHIPPSHENKRKVLEGAQYGVRYLTMTHQQIKTASGLLTMEEEDSVSFFIIHRGATLTKSVQDYQVVMSTPRQSNHGIWKQACRKTPQYNDGKKNKMTFTKHLFNILVYIID